MGLLKKYDLPDAGARVWVWDVKETPEELAAAVSLAQNSQNNISTLNFQLSKLNKWRRAEVYAEQLLIAEAFGKPLPLTHDENGAPSIEGCLLPVSISHTRGRVCLAVGSDRAIGIDVEHYREQVLRIRDKFLSPTEQAWIAPTDVMSHLVAWTAKEALYKVARSQSPDLVADYALIEPFRLTGDGMPLRFTAMAGADKHAVLTFFEDRFVYSLAYPFFS